MRILADVEPNLLMTEIDDEGNFPRYGFDGVKALVRQQIVHPLYNSKTKSHDFMILKLATKIPIIRGMVQYARLPDEVSVELKADVFK